jgi:hypothetical protein
MLRTSYASLRRALIVSAAVSAAALNLGLEHSVRAQIVVLGVQYQQDNPYPEYNCWYRYGGYPTSCDSSVTGAYVHVFLKNNGGSSVTMNDVTLAGYSLKTVLKRDPNLNDSASIYYYWDDPPQAIFNAGEPVWYRLDPNPIPPGGVARATVRLRLVPVTQPVNLSIVTSAGTVTTNVAVNASDPLIASVGFSPDRKKIYLHWRRNGGAAPTSVWLDGTNVTAQTTTVGDASMNFAASVIQLSTALPDMSYHVYQGVYADGKRATAGLRTWVNPFLYGTWAARDLPDGDTAGAQAWIDECVARGANVLVMNMNSSGLADFLGTSAGRNYADSRGYGYVKDSTQWGTNPRMWFIEDEPDMEEYSIGVNKCGSGMRVPCGNAHVTGILGLRLLEEGEALRAINPSAPTTVNLDGNFKPEGWFAYGQLADVMMVDSYYEQEMAGIQWYRTNAIPLYTKPTSIYAAAITTTTAAEPNPMHMILYSCEYRDPTLGYVWPFASPASKRIQAYYALAGGAKGMAYWWFKKDTIANGLDANTPAAQALWKEIGLIGNEIKAAQPLLVISHPVAVPITPGSNVWARALASGIDALIVIAVNDKFTNTWAGTQISSVSNATVTVTLPAWLVDLNNTTAFEISAGGIQDVASTLSGNQLILNLGTLKVTRMVVVTTNQSLRASLQARYDSLVKTNVCSFAPEVCDPPAPCIRNPGAEDGFTLQNGSYIAKSWIEFEGPYGTNVTGYAESAVTNVHSGSYSQRIRVWGQGGTYGGCYQRMGATAGQNYSISAWIKAYDTLSKCYLGVDPTGGTNPDGASVVWSSVHTNTTWAKKTINVTASGSSGYITVFYKVVSTDSNKRNGYFDDASPACPTGPSITQQPAAQNLCAGGTASFTVVATGSGTISYEWKKDGVTLFDDGHYVGTATPTLVISNVGAADVGSYSVIVSDVNGSTASTSAALTLKTATAFTQQPADTNACLGGTATFSVTAVGDGPIAYQWQKNLINLSNGGHYSGVTTPTLIITNADSSDAGNYRCVATAGCGSAISFQGALNVLAPTTITQQPQPQNVCAGATVSFSVAATGEGALTYQWQTNGVNLSNNAHYAGADTPTLWVTNVTGADAVNYRCIIGSSCGSVSSTSASLTLKPATAITQQPANSIVIAGSSTNFTVAATGDGPLTYQWQKNQVNLADGGHYSGVTTPTLTISNADGSDAANYRCVVAGGCGSAVSAEASLAVCTTPGLVNPSFEGGSTGGVGTGWIGYQRPPNPTTVWSIQTASPPSGGGLQYQQIANTSSTGGGGVRQNITGCVPGAKYRISGWMRGNSAYATCTVKVSPTASTSWSTAINLNPPQTYSGNTWTAFSGTVVATGTNMTLWLDGQTGGTGLNKAECFDAITVTCEP